MSELHQPKGSMCMNCRKYSKDCSDLNFDRMPVIEIYKKGDCEISIVRCSEFRRVVGDEV